MCIRNKNHPKTESLCPKCLEQLDGHAAEPDVNQLYPELRALFTQLTLQNRDLSTCWKSTFKKLTVDNRKLTIQNVFYAFYKGDIGNAPLKRLCTTLNCVNPAHNKSRYEPAQLTQQVRRGFNRKITKVEELTDNQWKLLP
jgi:hypothetical protein